ncbi:acylphosphatase [Thermomicrobium sp. 4228-Ro]|uniref:acylphosphatase n=1 Tax=Thermomicrobium sp. 4228-Ro TaxID=2993937 RepID=UPI002248BA7F|nr:acylphosphatase [Thermomicrobium sp. 4228-Ro]MCX2726104.1 acylphosphatase [Thermomicrobium sp. 4228-Ro]
MSERAAVHCVVYGRVQGVGFRFFVVDEAEHLGLVGWVRNRPDGRSVELWAEGPRAALERLVERVRVGPPGAWVERADCTWVDPTGQYDEFVIRR